MMEGDVKWRFKANNDNKIIRHCLYEKKLPDKKLSENEAKILIKLVSFFFLNNNFIGSNY